MTAPGPDPRLLHQAQEASAPRPDPGLAQALAMLVELGRRARQANNAAELEFLLVNDSLGLVPYRQAVYWQLAGGVRTLSGLVEPERNAPYVQWLGKLCEHLSQPAKDAASTPPSPRAFTAADLPSPLAAEWSDWWPAHALWVPIDQGSAGVLFAAEQPFTDNQTLLLQDWVSAWWHARCALRSRGGWFKGRSLAPAGGWRRAWWFRPWLFLAIAVAAALTTPVPLSVLAPGELVPANPVVVRAPIDGVIESFQVQPNQTVRRGQPLFAFDQALIQSRLEVAQQALSTAGTEYRQTSLQALSDQRSRPQLAGLTGRIQEKRAEADYLREQLSRTRVSAPQDGIVLLDDPSEWIGKPVSIGERILRIATPGDVEVEAWVPVADAIVMQAGAKVQLYLNANPVEPVVAKLRYLSHDAVQRPDGSFAYRMRATLETPTAHRVGLKGTAKLQGEHVPAAYWVLRRPLATLRSTLGL